MAEIVSVDVSYRGVGLVVVIVGVIVLHGVLGVGRYDARSSLIDLPAICLLLVICGVTPWQRRRRALRARERRTAHR
jgi:uncharacterized protein YjeT (DUF2065 family)